MLHHFILSHVTYMENFAVGLRLSVAPCIHIHTLCFRLWPLSLYTTTKHSFVPLLPPFTKSHTPLFCLPLSSTSLQTF
ncbi:hypothetical protein E2C01_008376 [Portunus trituberculatus]|uniref:Uncharacterized protein n=1 Tax=Portunus trituberculatus TaxID=210409 RepID=A0A5B7D0M9_PORTR|nr:hypothetical protein [Portunus trituberculatus]